MKVNKFFRNIKIITNTKRHLHLLKKKISKYFCWVLLVSNFSRISIPEQFKTAEKFGQRCTHKYCTGLRCRTRSPNPEASVPLATQHRGRPSATPVSQQSPSLASQYTLVNIFSILTIQREAETMQQSFSRAQTTPCSGLTRKGTRGEGEMVARSGGSGGKE